MTEEQQDYFLAEWLIDGYEQGLGRSEYGSLLSALGRLNPRCRYKVSWKVFETWATLQPPQQAAAAPPELITAMMVVGFALNRFELSLIICLAYAGLLRVSEALQLCWKDVVLGSRAMTLCLGNTKRGMEQKVVVTNPVVAQWVLCYKQTKGLRASSDRLFSMSYSSVLRWVKKLANLLGADSIALTTHSFRRSGASELARRGIPFTDIMLFGRWLSDRSAREYIRKGEVAILRTQQLLGPGPLLLWSKWCRLLPYVWQLQKMLSSLPDPPAIARVTPASFGNLQQHVFHLFEANLLRVWGWLGGDMQFCHARGAICNFLHVFLSTDGCICRRA